MSYNLTLLKDAETIPKLIQYADISTGNVLMHLFILAVFFVLVFKLKTYSFSYAFTVSCFVCFIISGFLWYMGMLSIILFLAFFAGLVFSSVALFMNKEG